MKNQDVDETIDNIMTDIEQLRTLLSSIRGMIEEKMKEEEDEAQSATD